MTHAAELNKRLKAAGVLWHECLGCGRAWPFPKGGPTKSAEDRDWKCAVCAHAMWSQVERVNDILTDALETLEFYARPESYFAILFIPDPPAGEFMDDFSETALGRKPGRRAREAIDKLDHL